MGEKGHSHLILGISVATVLEAIVIGFLHWLESHEFWIGFGAAAIPAMAAGWFFADLKRKGVQKKLDSAKRATENCEAGLVILHKAAETVRRAAIASRQTGGYSREQFSSDVRHLLETRLREYLHARLGGGSDIEYAVTIKWISTRPNGEQRLVSVFRDQIQGQKRPIGEEENLKGNYFYEKLSKREHIQSELLCLPVHNAHAKEIPAELKSRAIDRGYQSCLVIPLNLPFPEPLQGFGLVGFLSIDAPKPWIFTEFFSKVDPGRDFGCQGENHKSNRELNLLYGLADAVATIDHLTEEKDSNGK